jgi:hypothetical protein
MAWKHNVWRVIATLHGAGAGETVGTLAAACLETIGPSA